MIRQESTIELPLLLSEALWADMSEHPYWPWKSLRRINDNTSLKLSEPLTPLSIKDRLPITLWSAKNWITMFLLPLKDCSLVVINDSVQGPKPLEIE